MTYDAVVLAGGASSRFGGDKLAAVVGGRSLLDQALDAVADAETVVLVGTPRGTPRRVICVQEDPPGSGPAYAVSAALPHVLGSVVVLLAADQLDLLPRIAAVRAGLLPDDDGAALVDHDGQNQWLLAAYRTDALRSLAPPPPGTSLREWLAPLRVGQVVDPLDSPIDVDTPADLRAARLASGSMLEDWVRELADHLGIDPSIVDVEGVLDLARDAANAVERPAAPVATFLAGYAAARAGGDADAVRAALTRASGLARSRADEG